MNKFEKIKAEKECKQIRTTYKCRVFPISEYGKRAFDEANKYLKKETSDIYFNLNYHYPIHEINEQEALNRIEVAAKNSIAGKLIGGGRNQDTGIEKFSVTLGGTYFKDNLILKEDYDVEVFEVLEYLEEKDLLTWSDIKAI
ncbi:hypothetical protein NGB24_07145 [Mammaliicoccus vitulinus]|uniref:hypothetical protein n=1 Tax=Mammaliicoccus vitulinus TaxID=71237 RepID=UPI002DB9874D|nr:hypothetical protein [Mammaliicoccus vitulinus]MEB7657628.1 hypothetical protein [Mammaliicoccus vitulinus]